jgi:hypothetical protein
LKWGGQTGRGFRLESEAEAFAVYNRSERNLTMVQPMPIRAAKPTVPTHLAQEEAELYASITRAYGLKDEAALKILEEGLRSLQIARECNEESRLQGRIVFEGRDDAGRGIGRQKLNPLCNLERDSRAAFLTAMRQLNLELPRTLTKRQAW